MSEENVTENVPEGADEPKEKGKSKLFLIIIIVVLAIGGGGGFYFWSSSSSSETEESHDSEKEAKKKSKNDSDEEHEEDEDEDKDTDNSKTVSLPDDEDVKHIIELEPFVVNLVDSDQARYLRLTVNLGIGGDHAEGEKEEEPDKLFIAKVKNAMLSVLSLKTTEDVMSIEGKTKLRKELLKAAQAVSGETEVEAVYITDFLVQL